MSKIEVCLVLRKTFTWAMYLPYNPTCNYSVLKQLFWACVWDWDHFNALQFPCSCPCFYYTSYSPVIQCQSLMKSILYILAWWVSVLPRTRAGVCLQPQCATLAFFCWMSWPPGCTGLLDVQATLENRTKTSNLMHTCLLVWPFQRCVPLHGAYNLRKTENYAKLFSATLVFFWIWVKGPLPVALVPLCMFPGGAYILLWYREASTVTVMPSLTHTLTGSYVFKVYI